LKSKSGNKPQISQISQKKEIKISKICVIRGKKTMDMSFKTPAKPSQIKVAVLMGGVSREREVSIESGRCVAEALKQAGVNVVVADVKPDPSRLGVEPWQVKLDILEDHSIDVFFIALHGTFGEDGVLQEILESKGLIYTGSGPQASKLAFDKWASKEYFTKAGIPIPDAILFEPNKDAEIEDRIRRLGKKYVVKPLREGSTFGVSIVNDPKSVIDTAEKCAQEFGDCMIEEFIAGREFTVSVLGKDALPILEIRAKSGFYDYQAKYLDDQTQYLFDTINDAALVTRIQKSAIDCFNSLGCRGVARVDFIVDGEDVPYVLEINTIPGMTSHSLLPKAAAKAGISMSQLCMKMVEMALAETNIHGTSVRRK
jgi:D-alanine-D-alanine ligase